MKLLIATHNPAKFARYKQLLNGIDTVEVVSLLDVKITTKINEPYSTAKENAYYKATTYATLSKLPTTAIDEAVTTNFLPKDEQPGVYVRRFLDKKNDMTDKEVLAVWSKIFATYQKEDKQFTWEYSIAFFNPQTQTRQYCKVYNTTNVAKVFSRTIIPGYPMSSFLIYQGTSKPNAELTKQEKSAADRKIFSHFLIDIKKWIVQK